MAITGPQPRSLDLVGLGHNPRICISNRFPVDDSVGLGTILLQPLGQDVVSPKQPESPSFLPGYHSSASVPKVPPKKAHGAPSFTTQNTPFKKEKGIILIRRRLSSNCRNCTAILITDNLFNTYYMPNTLLEL